MDGKRRVDSESDINRYSPEMASRPTVDVTRRANAKDEHSRVILSTSPQVAAAAATVTNADVAKALPASRAFVWVGKQMGLEFYGSVVSAFLSALAFFLPEALELPLYMQTPVSMALFFITCVIWELMHTNAELNPVVHLQQLLLGRINIVSCFIFSAVDVFGFMVGNIIGLWLLNAINSKMVTLKPGPPVVDYTTTAFIEGLIFVALQIFNERGTKSVSISFGKFGVEKFGNRVLASKADISLSLHCRFLFRALFVLP